MNEERKHGIYLQWAIIWPVNKEGNPNTCYNMDESGGGVLCLEKQTEQRK